MTFSGKTFRDTTANSGTAASEVICSWKAPTYCVSYVRNYNDLC